MTGVPTTCLGQVLCLPHFPKSSPSCDQEGPPTSRPTRLEVGDSRDQPPILPSKRRVCSQPVPVPQRGCCHPSQAAGNGLAQLAARAIACFPSSPFPLSGCFAPNSQSSAFPPLSISTLPPFLSGAGRIRGCILAPTGVPDRLPPRPPSRQRGPSGSPVQRPELPPAGRAWEHRPRLPRPLHHHVCQWPQSPLPPETRRPWGRKGRPGRCTSCLLGPR